jgi:FkbM family methyltransferase
LLGIRPAHVAEVGVYHPETSNILGFIQDGIRADLFEPDPESLARIEFAFRGLTNVTVYPFALYFENTRIRLYRAGASTFAADLPSSPALENDDYRPNEEDAFEADARTFDQFDDGTIDLLSIDTEGCEWYVLDRLKSRPIIISVETGWKRYRNPHLGEIRRWMDSNGYQLWYRDRSDAVYLHRRAGVGLIRRFIDRLPWWQRMFGKTKI